MTTDQKIDAVLKLIQEQGDHHELRFAQMGARFDQVDSRFTRFETRLDAKIDKVYESLSQDIQVFGVDLYNTKRRVTRLEKKFAS